MTAPRPIPDHSLIRRRNILIGAAATLLCAPAIVRAANLMPVRRLPFPFGPQYAGFVERSYFHSLEKGLQAALREGAASVEVCGHSGPVDVARERLAYAQAHGFLQPYICIYREELPMVAGSRLSQMNRCMSVSGARPDLGRDSPDFRV
jgi:hypothetical protein